MDYSVSIIIPNSVIYDSAKKMLAQLNLDYPIYRASQEEALQIAREMIQKKSKLILSAGHTFRYLKHELDIPVLEIPFSGLEAAAAIKQALSYSGRIVHIGAPELFHYMQHSLDILDVDSKLIKFCELAFDRTIEEQTVEMISEGYEVFIGGYVVAETARQYGKQGIEVAVDELVIKTAILNAYSLASEIVKKERRTTLDAAIFDSISDGIVVTDEEDRINAINPAAASILSLNDGTPVGKVFKNILDDNKIVDIDVVNLEQMENPTSFTPVVMKTLPMIVDEKKIGSVISINKYSEIKEIQYKARKQLYAQGLWAEHFFEDIKGKSKAISLAKEKAEVYAKYNSAVMITGETGVGKELFAQSIHNASRRRMQPWVPVNCASLPENLIESELFGYEKGAFTGANKEGKMGFFELADGGTIFLDEISELPIAIQSKLLRVIQEGDVIRVGGDKIIHVDARIICSSNKDLMHLIQEGKFKEDLYYRLCVLQITVPPLRERKEDIEDLSYSLISKFNEMHDKSVTKITEGALNTLKQMPLLGNVRELSNIIERAVIFTEGHEITSDILTDTLDTSALSVVASAPQEQSVNDAETSAESENLRDMQKNAILSALEKTGGNKAAAARMLGIDPSTLWRKLKKYGI